jgi:hypothetical protein
MPAVKALAAYLPGPVLRERKRVQREMPGGQYTAVATCKRPQMQEAPNSISRAVCIAATVLQQVVLLTEVHYLKNVPSRSAGSVPSISVTS